MELTIKATDNTEKGSLALPAAFETPVRPDMIARAFYAAQSSARKPYGADPRAGMKHVAGISRRRRRYRGAYGYGISRVPRKIMTSRGTRFNWEGAEMPGTVGGRRAHPPKSRKDWTKGVNKKEHKKALNSALAAVVQKDKVSHRGHKVPEQYPFVLADDFEQLSKTRDVKQALVNLGLGDELERSARRKIRAGRGTMRGRKYKRRVGPLFVVSEKCPLCKAAQNIPGVEVQQVERMNIRELAPDSQPGRLTLFSNKAIEKMRSEKQA